MFGSIWRTYPMPVATTVMPAADSSGPKNMKNRIFVVEDHPLMRKSIVAALEREADLAVCGQAEDAPDALAGIASLQPDLVLTDLELKTSSGFDLIRSLRIHAPALPILATTLFNVGENERRARDAGASDFVPKLAGPEKLVTAAHALLKAGSSS